MSFRRNQRGDTIIEVLIALTIVGLTIALAYGIATRSIRSSQQAQERNEALKVAEGQLETIKYLASDGDPSNNSQIFFTARAFCMDGVLRRTFTASGWNVIIPLEDDSLGSPPYPAECVTGPQGRYHTAIKAESIGDERYEFTISVRWFGINEIEKEQLTVGYRVHEP